MQQLLGDRADVMDGAFFCTLFLQRLPANVRMILASAGTTTTTLEQLPNLADKVVEVASPTIEIAATSPEFPQLLTEIKQLRTEVRQLQMSVQTLSHQSRPRGCSTDRSRQPSPSPA